MPEQHEPIQTRLPNGVRVISLRLAGASTAGAIFAVNTGSVDEPAHLAGVSHFLEHLMFRGTSRYDDSPAIGAAIEGVGGYFNAFTSKAMTAYLATAPLEHLELVCSIPAELVVRPLLRAQDVDDERPIVLREISMYEDNASRRALETLQALVWPQSAYGRPIIGFPDTLKNCSADAVRAYWSRAYRPDRAVFSVAGDVDHATVEQIAQRLAGDWQSAATHDEPAAPDDRTLSGDAGDHSRLRVQSMDRQRVELWFGTEAPSFATANRAELEALAALVAGGKGSRLNRVLLQEMGLVLQASSFTWLHRDTGVFAVAATAQPDRAGDAARAMIDELVALRDAGDAECARAVAFARGEYARSWAEPLGTATRIAEESLWVEETPSRAADKAAFADLSPDSIRAVAARLLNPASFRLAVVGPQVDSGTFAPILQIRT